MQRDGGGHAVRLADITGDDPGVGAGLCTYDPSSATGVIIVLHRQAANPFDMEFVMHATGVHPDVVQGVGGVAEAPIGASPSAGGPGTPLGGVAALAVALALAVAAPLAVLARRASRRRH